MGPATRSEQCQWGKEGETRAGDEHWATTPLKPGRAVIKSDPNGPCDRNGEPGERVDIQQSPEPGKAGVDAAGETRVFPAA